jgi:hypothetical protein
LLLQVVASEQCLALTTLCEKLLEPRDCGQGGELGCTDSLLGCSWSSSGRCGWLSSLGLRKGLDSNGHETSDEELSDGNHDY